MLVPAWVTEESCKTGKFGYNGNYKQIRDLTGHAHLAQGNPRV